MKTLIRLTTLLFLGGFASQGHAQVIPVCEGSSTVITAVNSSGLSNPSYSLNPGGITSSSPSFTVSPAVSTTYTLYVTGANSGAVIVTTSSTASVQVSGVSYSLAVSANTLGCNSTSVSTIQILNPYTFPMAGGAITYTFLAPGSSSVILHTLGITTSATVNIAGTWSVVVKDMNYGCTSWSTVNISMNTTPPVIGNVSVSQNPLTCSNPTALVQAPVNPAVTYVWQPQAITGNSFIAVSSTAVPTQSILTTLTLVATDNNNACQSSSVIVVYQNIYAPNPIIVTAFPAVCQPSFVLSHSSTSGIPNGTYSNSAAVIGLLWEGPSPQTSTSNSSTYLAQTTGNYTFTAQDLNNGCTSRTTIHLTTGPAAAFTHTITGGMASFDDASTGTFTTTTYSWDFGDGVTSTLQNPTHTYVSGGAYLVKFKISSPGIVVCTDSVIQSVTISGVACIANSNFSMVPTATAQVWDIVPAYPWNVTAASWTWGDGSVSNTLYGAHQYSAAGMYNICLSVTVSCVASSSTCTSYSVYRTSQEAMILEVNIVAPELVTGLNALKNDPEMSWNISPNPNPGAFNLQWNSPDPKPFHVVIRDLTGRIVHTEKIESGSKALIHPAPLTAGLYLVTLENDRLKVTKRMVVFH